MSVANQIKIMMYWSRYCDPYGEAGARQPIRDCTYAGKLGHTPNLGETFARCGLIGL